MAKAQEPIRLSAIAAGSGWMAWNTDKRLKALLKSSGVTYVDSNDITAAAAVNDVVEDALAVVSKLVQEARVISGTRGEASEAVEVVKIVAAIASGTVDVASLEAIGIGMGLAGVGGMLVATFVATLFIPLFYVWAENGGRWLNTSPAGLPVHR